MVPTGRTTRSLDADVVVEMKRWRWGGGEEVEMEGTDLNHEKRRLIGSKKVGVKMIGLE